MLPMPGAASSSWSLYRARVAALFERSTLRVAVAFWLLGLINNVLYVIILSAALDLVGPSIPKSLVLLFDVIPSFLLKLTAPYYIHVLSYRSRVILLVALSTCGMLLIALTPSSVVAHPGQKPGTPSEKEILVKMSGVVLASLSSGLGELSFLGLTSRYGHTSLAAWGSGTGAAGLVGAGAYVVATTTLGLSVKSSLFAFSFLPVVMFISFFVILPSGPSNRSDTSYQPVGTIEEDDDEDEVTHDDLSGLLAQPSAESAPRPHASRHSSKRTQPKFRANLRRARGLVLPYMLPLFMVYVAEYTINQGVSPTLLFPLHESPFSQYRSFYPTYNALYQLGVFISRSSLPFIHIDSLYTPSILQFINLAALTAHAMHPYIPTVYYVFVVVFWEGLLGGLVYVSTFRRIGEEVPPEDREFSLGAATVSDSAGICVAGFLGMAMETGLCNWQVAHGWDWCRRL